MKQINSRIQLKVDSAANWSSSNPTLLTGEVGFESNTGRYKVGDGVTSWTNLEYKNEENTARIARESSKAIVDVLELPTENIDENKFYRKQSAVWVYNQFVHNRWKCYIVESLPEVGENVIEGDINDEANVMVTTYYNISDETPYAYVNDVTGSAFGIPGGWYPANVFLSALQYDFGGVITDISDCVLFNTFYLLLDTELFSHKDKWISHKVIGRHGTGSSAEVFNHESNIASGPASHAEGQNTQATNYSAHAEGRWSVASGDSSHAEGEHTTASGYGSHAEGGGTIASGSGSHAEGDCTIASGYASHAGGYHTIASADSQTAIGEHNKENDDALFIVGNGTGADDENDRRNAFEVLKDGRAKSFGTPTEDNDLVTVSYVSNALSNLPDYATQDYVAENYIDTQGINSVQGSLKVRDTISAADIVGKNGLYVGDIDTPSSWKSVALEEDIPTKTSQLTNDSNFIGRSGGKITGRLDLEGQVVMGEILPSKGDGSKVYKGIDFSMLSTISGISGLYVNSAKNNLFYALHYNSAFECTCTHKGDGTEVLPTEGDLWYTSRYSDTKKNSGYLGNMFEGALNNGATFPVANLSTKPVVFTFKSTTGTRFDATDVLSLGLVGWRYEGDPDVSYHYGYLTDYKVEVCTNLTADTWVETFKRENVQDWITHLIIPTWSTSGGSANWTDIYGIRLTIYGAGASGLKNPECFGFTEIRCYERRPSGKPADGIGAACKLHPTIYGNLTMASKYPDDAIRPAVADSMFIGTLDKPFRRVYTNELWEKGEKVSNTYAKKTELSSYATKDFIVQNTLFKHTLIQGSDQDTPYEIYKLTKGNLCLLEVQGDGRISSTYMISMKQNGPSGEAAGYVVPICDMNNFAKGQYSADVAIGSGTSTTFTELLYAFNDWGGSKYPPIVEVNNEEQDYLFMDTFKYYKIYCKTENSLTIEYSPKIGDAEEYCGEIFVDEVTAQIVFPQGIRWKLDSNVSKSDNVLTFNPKFTYLFSILNNIGVVTSIENEALAKAVLTLNESIVSWDPVENAEYYEVYNGASLLANGDLILSTMSTSCDLSAYDFPAGSVSIYVKAISSKYTDSISANISYTATEQLAAPTGVNLNSSHVLSWDVVENANTYNVYAVHGGEVTKVYSGADNYIDLNTSIPTEVQGVECEIFVTASNSTNTAYLESEYSTESISYTFPASGGAD